MQQEIQKIWFVFDYRGVLGPFSQDEIQQMLSQGSISGMDLIWSRWQNDWQPLSEWVISRAKELGSIYLSLNGATHGPFTKSQTIEKLRSGEFPYSVLIWNEGSSRWLTIFENVEIAEAVGLSRRKFVRVPFIGSVRIGRELMVTATCLSEGGMGTKYFDDYNLGDEPPIYIASTLLEQPVSAKARLIYRTPDDIGFQFTDISEDDRGIVQIYAQKFGIQPEENDDKTQLVG